MPKIFSKFWMSDYTVTPLGMPKNARSDIDFGGFAPVCKFVGKKRYVYNLFMLPRKWRFKMRVFFSEMTQFLG